MSPRTRLLLPAAGLLLLSGCDAPPQSAPDYTAAPAASAPSVAPLPSLPPVTFVPLDPTVTTVPPATVPPAVVPTYTTTYPVYTAPTTVAPTTGGPLTKSPTPTPSHAAKCSGEPTKKQILALIKEDPGVPEATLEVVGGPYCSGTWSFTTVELAGATEEQVEPLQVVATGKGTALALVSLGTDVCIARVQDEAPDGIRVLACGF
ncbi:hypothetical protein ACTI_20560 [Actinoplanes sp. OR16]|uniref:hypothetical protein n=1 Tax=Actinoplanes sp. OR16 TaxID=946334 RepID=UPI000F6BF28C|nr:hypothetical protein [Actinoplanes sp. OR16]BBH65371.1 hypothetical protein ACTI_20560 [Actinoplanes sp. OR16]